MLSVHPPSALWPTPNPPLPGAFVRLEHDRAGLAAACRSLSPSPATHAAHAGISASAGGVGSSPPTNGGSIGRGYEDLDLDGGPAHGGDDGPAWLAETSEAEEVWVDWQLCVAPYEPR